MIYKCATNKYNIMRIEFYLNNDDSHIYTMYDMTSNPFKIGDIINLSVEDISPSKLRSSNNLEIARKMIDQNTTEKNKFHNKEIKLVREGKYIDIESDRFTIEYHCDFIS